MGSRKSKKKDNQLNRKMSAAADSSDKSAVEVWYKLEGGVVSPTADAVECVRGSTSIRKLRKLIHAEFDHEKKNRISPFELVVKRLVTTGAAEGGAEGGQAPRVECGPGKLLSDFPGVGDTPETSFIVEVPLSASTPGSSNE